MTAASPLRGLADTVRSREVAALETAIAYLRCAALQCRPAVMEGWKPGWSN